AAVLERDGVLQLAVEVQEVSVELHAAVHVQAAGAELDVELALGGRAGADVAADLRLFGLALRQLEGGALVLARLREVRAALLRALDLGFLLVEVALLLGLDLVLGDRDLGGLRLLLFGLLLFRLLLVSLLVVGLFVVRLLGVVSLLVVSLLGIRLLLIGLLVVGLGVRLLLIGLLVVGLGVRLLLVSLLGVGLDVRLLLVSLLVLGLDVRLLLVGLLLLRLDVWLLLLGLLGVCGRLRLVRGLLLVGLLLVSLDVRLLLLSLLRVRGRCRLVRSDGRLRLGVVGLLGVHRGRRLALTGQLVDAGGRLARGGREGVLVAVRLERVGRDFVAVIRSRRRRGGRGRLRAGGGIRRGRLEA